MPPQLKRYLRTGLLVLFGPLIMIASILLLRDGRPADAMAVLLFWPVVFYTIILSVANGMPDPKGMGAWAVRLIVGAFCVVFIVAFWVVVPQMWFTFVIALAGVIFATLVEALAPDSFVGPKRK